MVSVDFIIKSIDDAVLKCTNSSATAKQRGSNVSLTTYDDGSYTLEYDGASISFNASNNPSLVTLDGDEYPYPSNDSYTDFEYQKKELEDTDPFTYNKYKRSDDGDIIEEYSYDNDWDFIVDFSDNFASYQGINLNKNLIKGIKPDSKYGMGLMNKFAYEHFLKIERNSPIDNKNFVTVRIQPRLYDSDNISKEYFRLPQHICMSVGGDYNELVRAFGITNDSHARRGYGLRRLYKSDSKGDWKIFTVVKKGSGVTGLFMGNALMDSGTRTGDWEGELNVAPRTRFVRDVVDEENKIIIQHMEK